MFWLKKYACDSTAPVMHTLVVKQDWGDDIVDRASEMWRGRKESIKGNNHVVLQKIYTIHLFDVQFCARKKLTNLKLCQHWKPARLRISRRWHSTTSSLCWRLCFHLHFIRYSMPLSLLLLYATYLKFHRMYTLQPFLFRFHHIHILWFSFSSSFPLTLLILIVLRVSLHFSIGFYTAVVIKDIYLLI